MAQLKAGDRVLAAIVAIALVVAAAWFAWSAAFPVNDDGAVVVCQTKDGFRRVDPLSSSVEYTVVTGTEPDEGHNTVVIGGGTVDVTAADCSNQVCVDHDPISQVGEQIVCLPHGMVIEIVANEDDATSLV